jgi:hypothetical protein
VISAAENSNKFSRTRFWKEKSVEDEVTIGTRVQARVISIDAKHMPIYQTCTGFNI